MAATNHWRTCQTASKCWQAAAAAAAVNAAAAADDDDS
eukprot:CAMPEP_0202907168 /NCGR_PEP_ID=MMETSP1392-20130828/41617_1 /ASSEMBLY_ACC=CAM_ASM_000868 /TAXON_ID=225041 /ORGANISM="Chlamydomonas chlamydogama, Strain SAG 11-48b" /LENGTH=37 /DNA_ID= /DNA_START= /DNA_END= /DNA_ORIENTATION=